MEVLEITRDNIDHAWSLLHEHSSTLSMVRVYFAIGCADQFVYFVAVNCPSLKHFSINMAWITRSCRNGALAPLARRLETLHLVHATADDFIECYGTQLTKLFSKDKFVYRRNGSIETMWIDLEEYSVHDAIRMLNVTRCTHFTAKIVPKESFVLPTGFIVSEMYNPTCLRISMKIGPVTSTCVYVGESRIVPMPPGPISVHMFTITRQSLSVLAGHERYIVQIIVAMPPAFEDTDAVMEFLSRCPSLNHSTIQIGGLWFGMAQLSTTGNHTTGAGQAPVLW